MSIFNVTPINLFLRSLFQTKPIINANYTVDTNLTSDLFCNSLYVAPGVTLRTNNWRIFCLNSVINAGTISNTGTPGNNGTALAGGAAPTNPATGPLLPGCNGVAGVFNGSNGVDGIGKTSVMGATGSAGGAAGAFTGGLIGTSTLHSANAYFLKLLLQTFDKSTILAGTTLSLVPNSGSGSGAAAAGAAGSGSSGCAGGIIMIFAQTIINTGTITAQGGLAGSPFNDAATAVGGSGGGAGGLIVLGATNLTIGTTNVSRGNQTAGVNTGTPGGTASAGQLLSFSL